MKQKLWICGMALLVLTGCGSAKEATHDGGQGAPVGAGQEKATNGAGAQAPGNGGGSGGAQTGTPEPGVQRLTVVMKDFAFEPNVITLKKGVPVEVTLVNQGSRRHDFSIVGDFSFESDTVPNGEKLVVRFTPDKVGTFQLVCSQIGHKAAGMVAQVIVTE